MLLYELLGFFPYVLAASSSELSLIAFSPSVWFWFFLFLTLSLWASKRLQQNCELSSLTGRIIEEKTVVSLLLLTHFTAEKFFSVCVSGKKIGLVVPVVLTLTFPQNVN